MEVCSVVSVVCCYVEVSATSFALVQKSPTDCGASLCVRNFNNEEALAHWGLSLKKNVFKLYKRTMFLDVI